MLSRIFIQNFALIDSLEINLHEGLQVITGETGAGKSIILGALRLIMGERADVKSIQNSESKSIVEGEFSIDDSFQPLFDQYDLDFDKQTVIRRELLPNGKSRAFVNDVPVTLEVLKKISEQLIDIHSQFETSNLFSEKYQFEIIDGLCDNKSLLPKYQNVYKEYKTLISDLLKLKELRANGNKEADYKAYLLEELHQVDLDLIDLERLQSQLSLQENAETISENLAQIFARTDQDEVGVIDNFLEIKNKLGKVADLSHQFSELKDRFEQIFLDFKDVLFELQNKAENIDIDPALLAQLNTQLNSINALFLKHQVDSIDELIAIRDALQNEQNNFEEIDATIAETEKKIDLKKLELNKLSDKLALNRKKAAPVFTKKIEALLSQLGLEKAKIEVSLAEIEDYNQFGKQKIEILFQANSGFALKPIQSAISGGERSRVMLAVKKIVAENAQLPTLILDEIDTGVSGKVAAEMGKVMKEMSKDLQLIVITHLAQVAAKGNSNYKVVKKDVNGKTQSTIIPLNSEETLNEIAQLLSGSVVTQAAVNQAKELMN